MNKSDNINFNRVEEMAEGDLEFKSQLLNAIYSSIQDLKIKYIEGLSSRNEEIIQQARHKIKPTLSLFELNKLSSILQEGKKMASSEELEKLQAHQNRFLVAIEDLLEELSVVIN